MANRILTALVIVFAWVSFAQAADPQLVQELKQMGQAVDNMSIHISTATSDADAAAMAQAVQQTFAANLGGNPKPQVAITASAGRCDVLITTPLWKLWSRAENGKIIDHGATIH
jgi:hypothetical protein